jgi:hypothetical protein
VGLGELHVRLPFDPDPLGRGVEARLGELLKVLRRVPEVEDVQAVVAEPGID